MKLKALVLGAALALVGASVAFAAPPAGKGKPESAGKPAATGPGCKPSVAVVLKGTLGGDGAAAPFSLAVTVTGGNHFAAAYKKLAQPVSITVATTTKVNRQGDRKAADLRSGDRVNVQARACKADLADGNTPALTATRVTAHPKAS